MVSSSIRNGQLFFVILGMLELSCQFQTFRDYYSIKQFGTLYKANQFHNRYQNVSMSIINMKSFEFLIHSFRKHNNYNIVTKFVHFKHVDFKLLIINFFCFYECCNSCFLISWNIFYNKNWRNSVFYSWSTNNPPPLILGQIRVRHALQGQERDLVRAPQGQSPPQGLELEEKK